jgi:hypothetical protein
VSTIDVFCRYCQADEGQPCRTHQGATMRGFHSDRVRLARMQAQTRAACETCGGPVIKFEGYGWAHLVDGYPVFPACHEGRADSVGHTPIVTPVTPA